MTHIRFFFARLLPRFFVGDAQLSYLAAQLAKRTAVDIVGLVFGVGLADGDADTVLDHQTCQLVAVDDDQPHGEAVGEVMCLL